MTPDPVTEGQPIRVEPIDIDPPAQVGGIGPVLVQTDAATTLLYPTVRGDFGITWIDCYGVRSGWPNDEVLEQHRFWGIGLEDVEFVGEVFGSDWINEQQWSPWEGFPRAHVQSNPRRHFIVLFEDITYEFLAGDFHVTKLTRSLASIERNLHHVLDDVLRR